MTKRTIEHVHARRAIDSNGCWVGTGKPDKAGYCLITVYRDSGTKTREFLHRYSFLAHGGALHPRQFLLHSCDNPPCCNPAHLRVGTHKENMRDMVSRGRSARGERNGASKLTRQKAAEIRDLVAKGATQARCAKAFGVCQATISGIIHNRTWKAA